MSWKNFGLHRIFIQIPVEVLEFFFQPFSWNFYSKKGSPHDIATFQWRKKNISFLKIVQSERNETLRAIS